MLLKNIYKKNNEFNNYRWGLCEDRHKKIWSVPNPFLEVLFKYADKIKNVEIYI